MRKLFIGATFMGALVVAGAGVGCDETSSGGKEAPTPSAAPVPSSAPSAAPSASAKAEKDKADKDKPDQDKEKKAEAPKDHKARLKALEEAWGSHDAKKVAALYAEDGVLKRPGSPDLKGREAIEKRVAQNFAAFKDMTIVPGRVWEKDKKTIVLEWVIKGTHTGDLPESRLPKASNKPFGVVGASWISVNDEGFIKEERNYLDSETLVGQLSDKEKEKEKHAVRAVVTTAPDGTAHHQASTAKEIKDAKDEKEKAELAKELELEKKNLEVEDKFAAEMNANKVDEALKRLPEDYTLVDYTQEKDVKGKKAFKELLKTWFGAFPEMKAKITDSFGDGEFAVMEFEYTGVQKGPLGAIKATNKPVSLHQLEVDELKDGKIVKSWSWGNNVEMLRELGVVPPPGAAPSAAPSSKPAP